MIAYKKEWLDNLDVHEVAGDVYEQGDITSEERAAIFTKYPQGFYTPNIFVRIGLFVLTLVIMLFAFGLLALLFMSVIESMIGGLLIFFAVLSYAGLEFMINKKNHFRSGVDDGLLWGASICLFCGIGVVNDLPALYNCVLIFIISLFGSLRYADRLMAVVCYLSMLGMVFHTCIEFGSAGKAVVPFIIMAASLLTYILVKKMDTGRLLRYYAASLAMIESVALVSLYAAGNYFVVRELSNTMFNLNLRPTETIPFGWLFWIFSCMIPVIYIAMGIQKKDRVILRIGVLLIAAIVVTIRNYHAFMSVETLMTVAGIILLGISYALIKYLHKPRHGFTYQETGKKNTAGLQLESLIIAESFAPGAEAGGTKFGGGSFGGGGSSGNY